MIFFNDLFQEVFGCLDLFRRRRSRWIDNGCADHFPGGTYHRKLTSGPEGRIPSKNRLPHNGRLHQKLLQILLEYLDRAVFRFFRQFVPDLPLNSRGDQSLIAVLSRFLQKRRGVGILLAHQLFLQIAQDLFLRSFHFYIQELFLFAPVQSQYPVSRQFPCGLFKFIIHLIDRLCLRILCRGNDLSLFHRGFPYPAPKIRLIGNIFCDNIPCACQSIFRRLHAFFRIHILCRQLF